MEIQTETERENTEENKKSKSKGRKVQSKRLEGQRKTTNILRDKRE